MLHIKVWCLPKKDRDWYKLLFEKIVGAATSVKEVGVESERDMLVNFPTDLMDYGLGTEVVVEVSGLWEKHEHRAQVRATLARALGGTVAEMLPEALVEVHIATPIHPIANLWTNWKVHE